MQSHRKETIKTKVSLSQSVIFTIYPIFLTKFLFLDHSNLLTSTAYLPPLAWYLQAARSKSWQWEAHENYQKGGYRNRCRIATANGSRWLSIPLEKGKHQATPIREVRISYSNDWPREHRRTIMSAYGRAPYFEFYAEPIFTLLDQKTLLLCSLNDSLQDLLNGWLMPPVTPSVTEAYRPGDQETPAVIDLRSSRQELPLQPPSYPQLFTDRYGFQGNLSVLDLLFCQGPAAATYLRAHQ
ncbi:hypothetical protein CEQ90_00095 [Lewinellaceae bacterium SD302]|nr:hypothetical protein CEQ90_00095 [Lewinellaceae bacterium SD302]